MARGRGRQHTGGQPGAGGGRRPVAGGGGRRPGRGRGRGAGGNSVKNFLAPHTGRQAGAIANAEAGAEYNPEIRTLREQAKGSRKREGDLGQWYAQLAGDYQAAQSAGSAALQSVEDTTTAQLGEAADRSSADAGRLASEDEQFAALVGGPKDTEGLAKIAQAGAAAQRARVSLNLPVEQEQADYVANIGGQKAAARMQGIEARQEEKNRRDKLLSQTAAVRKEKGAARVANKEKIRESDRSYQSELAKLRLDKREAKTAEEAAAASAALAQLEASRKASEDAIANRQAQERIGVSRSNAAIASRNAATSARSAKTSARAQRATAKHYEKENAGGLTTAEKRARGEHDADAVSAAKALLGIKVPKNAKQWAQFEAALIEKLGSSYAAEAARAVAQLRRRQAAQRKGAYSRRVSKGQVAGPPTPGVR
jgi:hypothetical protein